MNGSCKTSVHVDSSFSHASSQLGGDITGVANAVQQIYQIILLEHFGWFLPTQLHR
jgi:hypothetical protein